MVSLIFDKKIMFDIFAILSDPMGSKDTPIYKYVCTKALLLGKKLPDSSALLCSIVFMFWTKYLQCWGNYLEP